MQLDLIPIDEHALGFANPWYRPGFEKAVVRELAPGIGLRHLTAPYFIATKFEAFNDRGQRDPYTSHDLEDIITVIDGRGELFDELTQAEPAVRGYVVGQVRELLAHSEMQNSLPGLILEPIRTGIVIQRLLSIASLPQDPGS